MPQPIALEAYDLLAERYAAMVETKEENAYIERPAFKAVLGDVKNLNILDAACGPGTLTVQLLDAGATVTGFDISQKCLKLAKKITNGRARLLHADLAAPLPFESGQFDLVVSSLAMDYVYDWQLPVQEFYRVLKYGGRLVMSIVHPMGAATWYAINNVFGVQKVSNVWRGFGGDPVEVPAYYRSFEEILKPFLNSKFQLSKIVEAKPGENMQVAYPTQYERYLKSPAFLVIEAKK